jgi:hypothetical protein
MRLGPKHLVLLTGLLTWHAAGVPAQTSQAPHANQAPQQRDGSHDFDWDIGSWNMHVRRLLHPLTGSTTWVEYTGKDIVRKVWNGRANLGEVELDGAAGHLELLSLRLYDPQAHQWSMNITSSAAGVLSPPAVGQFDNDHATFVDQEAVNGRVILVRFNVAVFSTDSCRFEQAFSADGGRTWETNLIVDETRAQEQKDGQG